MAPTGWIRDSERQSSTCRKAPEILQDDATSFQERMEVITGLGCTSALLPRCPRGIKDASPGVLLPVLLFESEAKKVQATLGAAGAAGGLFFHPLLSVFPDFTSEE